MLTSSRVQLLTIILVFLTLLSLSCGGKGQEIRELAAEKLEGIAEKLADEGNATSTPSPTPETIPTDVPSITSPPTVPATTMPASVATNTPIPPPAPTVEATPTPPTIPTINAPMPTVTPPSGIPPSITVEPQSGELGQVVTITGSGFTPFTSLASLDLGGFSVLQPFPIATDASGEFTTDIIIPQLSNGDHEMVVTVGSTSTATTFTVTGSTYLKDYSKDYPAASITVEPQSAEPGQVVTITGSGFPPFAKIAYLVVGDVLVVEDALPPSSASIIPTDESGEFTTDVMIPQLPNGVYEVMAAMDGSVWGNVYAATTFTVN